MLLLYTCTSILEQASDLNGSDIEKHVIRHDNYIIYVDKNLISIFIFVETSILSVKITLSQKINSNLSFKKTTSLLFL